jgi:transcriptional regulator with XRE-family HTH domain
MGPESSRSIDLRVARRIRERRLRIGMTQQKLARLIGVAFQQAHKYERGISRISAGRLYRIATALEAPIAYFFEDDDNGRAHISSGPSGIAPEGC